MSSDKPISPDAAITVKYTDIDQVCATLDALCVLLETCKDLPSVTQSKGVYADHTNNTIDALNSAKGALLELIRESSASLRNNKETFRLTDELLARQTAHMGG